MSVVQDQLSKQAMLNMASDQTYNPLNQISVMNAGGGMAQDPSSTPMPGQDFPSITPLGPSIANAPMTGEQARHVAMTLAAHQRATAPMAPPLAMGTATGDASDSVPQSLRKPLTADEMRAIAPTSMLAREEVMRGAQDEEGTKKEMLGNVARTESGIREEERADKKLADIAGDKSKEQNVIDQQAVEMARQQEEKLQRIAVQGQLAADAQMKRVMAAADNASNASLHNFWDDKSAGARVLGVLSQAFAGAANGLAGNPSAPTPLDRIIQRDMEMQVANLNQKNQKLQNERGVLKDLYEQTGNAMQATTAMYVAAWKRIDLQGAQLNSKYGTQTSQAQYEKLHGIAEQRISQATDKAYAQLHSEAIQQFQHGVNTLNEQDAIGARSQGREVGENAKIYHLAGVKGAVDDRTYKNFKDEDQNYRSFVKQAEHVDWLFKHGSGDNGADWQDFNSARSSMFATLRQMQKTGAALSDAELKNAEAMLPSLAKGEVPGYAWLTNARNQMARLMATAGRGHYSMLDGTLDGVELDPNDTRFGHHVRAYMRQQAQEQAQRGEANGG